MVAVTAADFDEEWDVRVEGRVWVDNVALEAVDFAPDLDGCLEGLLADWVGANDDGSEDTYATRAAMMLDKGKYIFGKKNIKT